MQLSLNWLKDFVNIPKNITPEELAKRLTLHTVEVEGIKKQTEHFANVVIGKILEIKKHPNADRLKLTRIDIGNKKLDIVCGASNIEVGQLIPVALVGAILPNGLEIKEAEIRGEKSSGMLCSMTELGLGNDHSGIMILDKKAKVGERFSDYLRINDIVFEVDNKSLSNRPDLWGHYGIAREIGAFLNTSMTAKFKKTAVNENKFKIGGLNLIKSDIRLNVKVEDNKLCPRYVAVAINEIKIEPSPKWMQNRLSAVGMRPINNIVDITNYIMLELGQPLHAFDKLLLGKNGDITVRRAKRGEAIETLDKEKRNLDSDMLVIANKEKAVAIAGIIGGLNSGINDKTDSIVIECANFDYISIRKTSQRLGLRTESSMRFEKGLDPNLCVTAMTRVLELMKEICPQAQIAGKIIDIKNFRLNQGPIKLELEWLNKIVGMKFEKKVVLRILKNLGFKVLEKGSLLQILIPTWRATRDISINEDLVEEIVRIYGYEKLISIIPSVGMKAPEINKEIILERKIKDVLTGGLALTEVHNYSFAGHEILEKMEVNYSNFIKLKNPLSSDLSLLRQSLIPGLISNICLNLKYFESGGGRIRIFEIGRVYKKGKGFDAKDNLGKEFLPIEEKMLAGAVISDCQKDAFFEIKGIIETLFKNLHYEIEFKEKDNNSNGVEVVLDKEIIGNIFNIKKSILRNFKIEKLADFDKKRSVTAFEINLNELIKFSPKEVVFQSLPKYPSIKRDISIIIDKNQLFGNIKKIIKENGSDHFNNLDLIDEYESEKLGKDKKSFTFRITFQAKDRSLTDEEVNKYLENIWAKLREEFNLSKG